MTYNQALTRLDRVHAYLTNARDTKHPLTNKELHSLISDIDAVQDGLQEGLIQSPTDL